MTDRDALVNAVADNPREDAPRLALADWLEEHGQASRAEFVRVSCEAAWTRGGTERRAELLDRADDLLAEHEGAWLGEWEGRLIDWDFRRGFLRRVRMTAGAFLEHGEELLRSEPVARVVLVKARAPDRDFDGQPLDPDEVRAVVRHPAFGLVRGYVVGGTFHTGPLGVWLEELAAAKHVTRLRSFGPERQFSFIYRTPADVFPEREFVAFTRASHLASLRRVNLSVRDIPEMVPRPWLVPNLAAAVFASGLRNLNLEGCGVTAEGAALLATHPAFSGLRRLELSDNQLSDDAWTAVFNSNSLPHLRAIGMNENAVGAYSRSPLVRRIRRLAVRWPDRNAGSYADTSDWFRVIRRGRPPTHLSFRLHNPGRRVFRQMCEARWLRWLQRLELAGDSQGGGYTEPGVLDCLFRGQHPPRLVNLRMHEAAETHLLRTLASWPGSERLEALDLADDYDGRLAPADFKTDIPLRLVRRLDGVVIRSDEDAEQFLRIPGLERLTSLRLAFRGPGVPMDNQPPDSEGVSAAAAQRLLASAQLRNVRTLGLSFWDCFEVAAAVIPALADPHQFPRLRKLRFGERTDSAPPQSLPLNALRARFGARLDAW